MDLESTYGEWLARRVADELWRRDAIPANARDDVAAALRALEADGWWFAPPERGSARGVAE